ncbi:YabP/YqfC family sporulation protein [Jeotgalibacillus haloalkalitolerans]|uniref:YabP/YqfC family sporulation protein n=1 Tax=Jeotgalibacillus haloalkalitolerans TaxID=3104292 RepID=A0ABU5KM16_9BACL|nr:YabP/YqfC family sporulation protein [Jeotgalibacillus sp. HH7-29]MDZ5712210.1 YabP/YqfC family sporulation protein [Jeotgalibacillus sp. HH7-29]
MVKKHWLSRAADWLDLPEDLITDLPRIEWVALKTVKIENHKGIIHYSDSSIVFNVRAGVIIITGEHLMISSLSSEYASVQGEIRQIQLKGQSDD